MLSSDMSTSGSKTKMEADYLSLMVNFHLIQIRYQVKKRNAYFVGLKIWSGGRFGCPDGAVFLYPLVWRFAIMSQCFTPGFSQTNIFHILSLFFRIGGKSDIKFYNFLFYPMRRLTVANLWKRFFFPIFFFLKINSTFEYVCLHWRNDENISPRHLPYVLLNKLINP